MDGLSAFTIDTRIVYGLKGAGKTSYISDCIANDFFYKDGTTLILCFEQGKEKYDEEALLKKRTYVAICGDPRRTGEFCTEQIRKYKPDRIYVEMNAKFLPEEEQFPASMNITSAVTWIEWTTLDQYMNVYRQWFGRMIAKSQQVIFRGCPSRELLAPYSQQFRLMNHRASYLRQDPMGYHERAFDLFVPFSLEEAKITISEKNYLIFWLDAADHPEHYEGKMLCFDDPLELRQSTEDGPWSAGRVVMTCCMADLQFLSFELSANDGGALCGGWATMETYGRTGADDYGRRVLKLEAKDLTYMPSPKAGMILQGTGRSANRSFDASKIRYKK